MKDVGGEGGQPSVESDETLTEDDLKWIEQEKSGGSPLVREGGDGEGQQDKQEPEKASAAPEKAADNDEDDEDDVDEVTIDAQGKNRLANGQFVAKSAYLRVKEQRKADRQRAEESAQKLAKLEGRYELLAEVLNGGQQAQQNGKAADTQAKSPWDEADIDPKTDFLGAQDQIARRQKFDRQEREAFQKGIQARDDDVAVVQSYVSDIKSFATKEPGIKDAYNFLIAGMHRELEVVGGITDKAQREKMIAQQEQSFVRESVAAKKSPAEQLWKLAQARGFTPKAKDGAQGAENGKEAGAGKTQQQLDAEARLETVRKGMNETRSLSGSGGKPGEGLTMAAIDAMGDDEFAEFAGKMTPAQLREYLGG